MIQYCKKQVIKLFNSGVLKVSDARWYQNKGYVLEINNGKVTNIYKEK